MSTLVTSDLIQDSLENPEVIDITFYTDWKPAKMREVTYHASVYFVSGDSLVINAKDFGALVIRLHAHIEKYTNRESIELEN